MTPELRRLIVDLVDAVNGGAASGLITTDLIILANLVQREMSKRENVDEQGRAEATEGDDRK